MYEMVNEQLDKLSLDMLTVGEIPPTGKYRWYRDYFNKIYELI